MPDLRFYDGREQTYIKHYFLEYYLELMALIIGKRFDTINYIDCFAGPWKNRDANFSDTSFAIAVKAFRLAQQMRNFEVRFLFLEKEADAFPKLLDYANSIGAKALNRELALAVPEVLEFVRQGGDGTFTFIFIDPLGWTGFPLDAIKPLLEIRPGEVLINFMTDFIRRFIKVTAEPTRMSFHPMYGGDIQESLSGLEGLESEEQALRQYMKLIKKWGHFSYVGLVVVFNPDIETTQFHLLYATRDDTGIEKFKEVEQKAMRETERVRVELKQKADQAITGQGILWRPDQVYGSRKMAELRERYRKRAFEWVERVLRRDGHVEYDVLWRGALSFPLVWERDLKAWLKERESKGDLKVPLRPGQRAVKRARGNVVDWVKG